MDNVIDILRNGDREKVIVWIGKDGNAIHPGNGSYCAPCGIAAAHFAIRHFGLPQREARADGILFYA